MRPKFEPNSSHTDNLCSYYAAQPRLEWSMVRFKSRQLHTTYQPKVSAHCLVLRASVKFIIFMCMPLWVYMHRISVGAHEGQRASDPLMLQLILILGTEPGSSQTAVSVPNCWAILPSLQPLAFRFLKHVSESWTPNPSIISHVPPPLALIYIFSNKTTT